MREFSDRASRRSQAVGGVSQFRRGLLERHMLLPLDTVSVIVTYLSKKTILEFILHTLYDKEYNKLLHTLLITCMNKLYKLFLKH